ncbi:antibiotic biosynthesis monooxygenase family protein [Salimicrobium halophilum]|uniref:Heme-degrading monooxygenase HmoA n=1 Tax=Salimicrobium halophilum TaxID=86666 RepID=A0A1G8TQ36_9BACI|nr:antibiotic biosynthesis monooxygenase [Salimicrobium halophilum]SDJ43547.1 Heme-degrading monooxygenase HmoA [Salimicrobium halophilum]
MIVSMTNGTIDFLKKVKDQHPDQNIRFMQGSDSTVAYYEGDSPSVFSEGRDYEIVDSVGTVEEEGFVVTNNIPVSEEGRPTFEDRFKNRKGNVEGMDGFQAIRILRPKSGKTYVVLTQWRDHASFENWRNSQSFEQAHKKSGPDHKQKPSFIDGDAYIVHYHMIDPES